MDKVITTRKQDANEKDANCHQHQPHRSHQLHFTPLMSPPPPIQPLSATNTTSAITYTSALIRHLHYQHHFSPFPPTSPLPPEPTPPQPPNPLQPISANMTAHALKYLLVALRKLGEVSKQTTKLTAELKMFAATHHSSKDAFQPMSQNKPESTWRAKRTWKRQQMMATAAISF